MLVDSAPCLGLTFGGTVKGDPVKVHVKPWGLLGRVSDPTLQEIIKIAFENGINFFDTAEGYESGECEKEMYVPSASSLSTVP